MGSPEDEEATEDNETQHQVTLTKGFYLGVHPVTQAIWRTVTQHNPSNFRGDDLPVEMVSEENCQEFVWQLSGRDGTYCLPTEAEWEYACRAGTTTPFHFGNTCNGKQANCDGSEQPYGTDETGPFLGRTSPVGSYAPNAFGLYDMHGNVEEWCADRDSDYPDAATGSRGVDAMDDRMLRGGSWRDSPWDCRSASRMWESLGWRADFIGFRAAFRRD
jgi:formylglycine-generating enzyme required for sulfatase activity